MNAFAAANDILFENSHLALDAVWKAGGAGSGVTVRVVLSTPDEAMEWRETRIVAGAVILDVRMSEIPTLAKGDTFTVAARSATYVVSGDPRRDDLHLTWRAEARPS